MKKIITMGLLLIVSKSPMAAGLINDMQSCQALIEFVHSKLDSAPSSYAADDIKKVRQGLKTYNRYIQDKIVSPGLLQFNGGDKSKANHMQKQVDTYKKSLVEQLKARYQKDGLLMDQAIAINNCAKKSVPSGQQLEELKQALNTMVKLAKMSG